jgi:hypothetical protein
MAGSFATQPQGILTIGPFAGPFSATGIIHFDGAGRFEGVATSSFNGSVIFPFDAVGAYSVSPDCFVTVFEETLRIAFEGYVTKGKNEVVLFQPQDTAITTNVLRRLLLPSCNNATLNSNWTIQASGSNIITSGSFAQNGRFRFDGNGNLAGVTASSLNGIIVRHAVTGTYRMNADCTFSARYVDEQSQTANFFGTMHGDGREFLFIYSNDGVVITGEALRSVESAPAASSCNPADIQGGFAVQARGILTSGPLAGPYAITGIMRFDGASRFTATGTASFNGSVFPLQVSGTYGVTPDCFVTTFEQTIPIAFEGYLTQDKNQIVFFQPQDTTIGTNTLRRVRLASCDAAALSDNWTIQAFGSSIGTPGSFAQNGKFRFDGNGNFTGVTASSFNGGILRNAVAGTYQMNSDCTFTASYTNNAGQRANFSGAMVGDGREFIFIYSNDGLVITGVTRQAVQN